MSQPVTFLDSLSATLLAASIYNRNDQAPPAAVLWTDRERQWEPLLPRLCERLPLLTLGPYQPEQRTGPAYWIRCMIAGTLEEDRLPAEDTPIIYLPGVSRQEMRAVEECSRELQPLVELQYRGVLWTQKNGRDWTVAAFLQSQEGGLGIQVGADNATKEFTLHALPKLADEAVLSLEREAPLRADFFEMLLNPDPVRRLLLWLNDPAGYRERFDGPEWVAFRARCKREYGFDPEKDGDLTGGRLLGQRAGAWGNVWARFKESPWSCPNLPDLLRRARPQMALPLGGPGEESWPQENDGAEAELRGRLAELREEYQVDARKAIEALEAEHAPRRSSVWATLGLSPVAKALEHIAALASIVGQPLAGGTVAEIADAYAGWGWKADAAAMDALAAVENPDDVAAVKAAVVSIYGPWLEEGANAFQNAVLAGGAGAYPRRPLEPVEPGACLLFTDGLRLDLGRGLASRLQERGLACRLAWQLAALPSVTSTSKPAATPVGGLLSAGPGLEVVASGTGSQLTADGLRKLLSEAGYHVLKGDELGDPSGRGWTELGDVDSYCHEYGWKVAHQAGAEVRALAARIEALVAHGWKQVRVITDHGWLMLPGGLPKAELPEHLTEVRKGRCARLKEFAGTDELTVPWFWDSSVRVATPRGILCYEAGRECEHGGLSPQECVVPILVVSAAVATHGQVDIESLMWKGMRCTMIIAGNGEGVVVDLRGQAGDPGSSLIGAARSPNPDGTASLLVKDEDRMGQSVYAVVIGADGKILAQTETQVGG